MKKMISQLLILITITILSSCSGQATNSNSNNNSNSNSNSNSNYTYNPKDFCSINDLEIESFIFGSGRVSITVKNDSVCIVKYIKVEFSIESETRVIDSNWFYAVGSVGLKPGFSIKDDYHTKDKFFGCAKYSPIYSISSSCTETFYSKTYVGHIKISSARFE